MSERESGKMGTPGAWSWEQAKEYEREFELMEREVFVEPPTGPPPSYPQQPAPAHYDAGPANASYYNQLSDPRAQQGYYGSPAPQGYGSPAPYQQGPYGPPQQQGYQQGPYGPPQQQGMYYQQQPMYAPQGGYYQQQQRGSSGEGICAGIMGALACCCCLDLLL
ncbi:hypothetical protein M8818_004403 [Zalaria obscura]|uniref:Uncharacterized protein n=1 Tax=Zalaria obscura TaxID=2024903 RepID=A0ACC3SBF0_9PEZI